MKRRKFEISQLEATRRAYFDMPERFNCYLLSQSAKIHRGQHSMNEATILRRLRDLRNDLVIRYDCHDGIYRKLCNCEGSKKLTEFYNSELKANTKILVTHNCETCNLPRL